MRVIINGLAGLERKTGVGHYIESLHERLADLPDSHRDHYRLWPPQGLPRDLMRFARDRILLPRRKSAPPLAKSISPLERATVSLRSRLAGGTRDLGRRFARLACRRQFAALCRRGGFDLYHEPNYLPFAVDLPTVTTVLDLSVLRYPEWHPADRVLAYETHFFRGLARSEHLITISEFTRREMIRCLGVSPDKVTAVHIGMRDNFVPAPPERVREVRRAFDLTGDYLLHVGTIEPRKNLRMLMEAYVGLPEAMRRRCPLVLAGNWGWRTERLRDWYETYGIPSGVRKLDYVPECDLAGLLGGATALVYPSLYEGFGLPPLEMMACGGAVLASNIGALREVLPADATLIDPDDTDGWREAMRLHLAEPERLDSLRQGASAFAARYTWTRCAEGTDAVYRRILGRGSKKCG